MSKNICSNCVYWNNHASSGGVCKRYPPKIVVVNGDSKSQWPITKSNDTCGEFKSKNIITE